MGNASVEYEAMTLAEYQVDVEAKHHQRSRRCVMVMLSRHRFARRSCRFSTLWTAGCCICLHVNAPHTTIAVGIQATLNNFHSLIFCFQKTLNRCGKISPRAQICGWLIPVQLESLA